MNTQTDRPAIPFTVSSVFFMLAAVVKVFNLAVLPTRMLGEFGEPMPLYAVVSVILTLLLAAFLIVKKFFIVNTVIIGLLTANEIYIMLDENFFFRFRDVPQILEGSLPYIFPIIVWILIFIISIGAIPKYAFKGVRKLCFLPIVITFAVMPLYLLHYGQTLLETILYGNYTNWTYNVITNSLTLITYILEVIAVTLLCKWYGRVIRDQNDFNKELHI